MKNFRIFIIILIFSAVSHVALSQNTDPATYFARFITAQKYRLGEKPLSKDTVKALNLYIDCAENGKMPAAMNMLGALYQKGMCAPKDLEKAFYWFSKSVEKGNAEGMFHLGTMYKTGEGVAQDFEKAYGYFKASAEKGFPGGMYAAGYCSYKGLGTAQSYDEAVKWFKKGVEKNSPVSTFMLGTCYRNGYGVEKNEQEAKRLLTIAAEKNIPDAVKELKRKYPEVDRNKKNRNNTIGDNKENNNSPEQKEQFKKLLKHQDNLSLSGIWAGTRYFYDWSGQHLTKEDSLYVILKQTGNMITGQWFENGKLVVNLNGMTADGQIVFSGSEFMSENRLGESYQMQFKSARFESINTDVNYLAGNIDSYSPYTKEPGYPCYVVMSRLKEKSAEIDSLKTKDGEAISVGKLPDATITNNTTETKQVLDYFKEKIPTMTVYPNPFRNEINVTYKTIGESDIKLSIYSSNGSLILMKPLGIMPAGTFTENVQIGSVSGHYVLVKLMIGTEPYTQVIIKQ